MPSRYIATFDDIGRHNELIGAESAFLKTRREDKAERQRRGHRMKQPLIGFHAALLDDGLEIRNMKRGNVVAERQAVLDHEETRHPAAAKDEGLVLFR